MAAARNSGHGRSHGGRASSSPPGAELRRSEAARLAEPGLPLSAPRGLPNQEPLRRLGRVGGRAWPGAHAFSHSILRLGSVLRYAGDGSRHLVPLRRLQPRRKTGEGSGPPGGTAAARPVSTRGPGRGAGMRMKGAVLFSGRQPCLCHLCLQRAQTILFLRQVLWGLLQREGRAGRGERSAPAPGMDGALSPRAEGDSPPAGPTPGPCFYNVTSPTCAASGRAGGRGLLRAMGRRARLRRC